jgi:L-amino acid N-acyltransferase YncA
VQRIFGWYAENSVATFEESPRTDTAWIGLCDELVSLGLPFLVADADGQVAGYAYASPWRRKPAYRATVEDSIFIAPGKGGLGIGKQLLGGLIAACADAGARHMIAVIADDHPEASVGLHRSCGFTEAGRLDDVGYKHGKWIGTLLMQRALG